MSAATDYRRPSSADDVRQHIVNSLFWKRAEDGTAEETLISFLKVLEDESQDGGPPTIGNGAGAAPGAAKTRYLMLAVTKLGKVVLHKAKRNANLSFSKGKTWNLEDMRALEVIGPTDFALTMTIRRYHWTSDRSRDQQHFLTSIVKVYRTYTKGEVPELIGFVPTPTQAPSNGNGVPDTRRTSSSGSIPPPGDLRPPSVPKTARSGSSSSVLSTNSSTYNQSEHSQSSSRRATPTGTPAATEEQRTPTVSVFGRSPANDPSYFPPASGGSAVGSRRPSGAVAPGMERKGSGQSMDRRGSSQGSERKASADANGLGMERRPSGSGMPSRLGSGDRLASIAEPKGMNGVGMGMPSGLRSEVKPGANGAMRGESRLAAGRDSHDGPLQGRPTPIGSTLTPTITTTQPSPLVPAGDTFQSTPNLPQHPAGHRPQRRASFHPPPLTTAFSREVLLTSRTGVLPGAAGLTVDEGDPAEDAVMANVEEMLEGFDWTASAAGEGGRKKGSADAIESRLLDELAALDSANIHAFLESDDRIAQVLGHIDEALLELDEIDIQITGYRLQLNAVSDDISFIEGQNRGLQVQTSNQQALLNELRQLLQIVEVPQEDLRVLTQESPGSQWGIQLLEQSATALYKALQAGMDQANAEVAATIARMREYQENSAQFCKRILDYLEISFKYQSDNTLAEYRKVGKKAGTLAPHTTMGEYLMMYEGLVLYVKEMDEERYQRLCSIYMASASQLHQSEMKDLLMGFMGILNSQATGDPNEASFATAAKSDNPKPSALAKSRAAIGLAGRDHGPKEKKPSEATERVGESYQKALMEIINQIVSEEDFINAFLHLTDTESTFADHMELDSYFRRQAARHATKEMSKGMVQLVRSMMDLVFGFVDGELRDWIEAATNRNPITVVSVLAVTERLAKEAEQEDTSIFFAQMFDKLLARQNAALDAFVAEQIRAIDAAKMSTKKRKGVAFFVKHFPVFVERLEAQMEGNEDLSLRGKVNDVYEKIINAMFGSLQQIAKMDRAEGQAAEDKGQLNYHVIMIENMHQLSDDLGHLDVPALGVFHQRAKGLYEDNLSGYIKLILRRSFGRLMDFFDGVERLLQTTPANEVSLHQNYSRSALKKMLKDYTAKDMRKAIDAMSKRVDKQFSVDEDSAVAPTDAATAAMVAAVWREVTAELKREVSRDGEIISKSYADSGLGMEFGAGEVEAACKRVK